MGIISSFKNMAKNAMGYDELKKQAQRLKTTVKGLAVPQKPLREETFEEALKRLNLTETDIEKRTQEFKKLTLVFSLLSLALLIYLIYVLFQKAVIASLGTLGILCVVLAQLFRYHFWLFQVRQRRLGCTFKEWLYDLISR